MATCLEGDLCYLLCSCLGIFSKRAALTLASRKQPTFRIVACVAWWFWLGPLSNKGGRGQKNREASPLVLACFAREFPGFAACAPGWTKPPCYAGYSYRHHWFHFREETSDGVAKCRLFFQAVLVQTSAENYVIK